ncbi:hypothetical protein CEP53_015220 [Fusarium sp. AF-6]|nr:hypothetical protein CEP53_015220 [Fusarium sp. AF-6]
MDCLKRHVGRSGFLLEIIIILCHHVAPAWALSRSYAQYKHFFPAWDSIIKDQLKQSKCQEPLANYRNQSKTAPQVGYFVIDCILETMPEFRKAELAASAVILGLAPALLQVLSASYLDTAVLAFRRPGLALLLSISSSGVRPGVATQYDDFIDKLERAHLDPLDAPSLENPLTPRLGRLVSCIQYIVAFGAVANNAYLAYQLSVWAVSTFPPAIDFLPAVWTAACFAIHVAGYMVARLCMREAGRGGAKAWYPDLNELTPMTNQRKLKVEGCKETSSLGAGVGPIHRNYITGILWDNGPVKLGFYQC